MPSDKYATVHVNALDLPEIKELLRALATENRLLRDALQQAHECCARPAGVCFPAELIDGDVTP